MKQKINVIDLDNTLIDYDSFQTQYLSYLKQPNCFFQLLSYGILRKLNILPSADFAALVYAKTKEQKNYTANCEQIASDILKRLNKEVIEKISYYSPENTINILCSASPQDYVKLVAQQLGWQFLGSHFDSNHKFIHMYSFNKLAFLQATYPEEIYEYNFAISDSTSDTCLLDKFTNKILYNGKFSN